MSHYVWQRTDAFARQLLPCAVTIALAIVSVLPLHIPYFGSLAPSVSLIAVFYWTLYRPDLMPVWAVFVLGLVQDTLLGLPIGVSACMLTAAHAFVATQRRFLIRKSFGVVWMSFKVVALGAFALGWVLTCIYHEALLAPETILLQALVTFGLYPLLSRLLLRCELTLLRQT